MEKQNDNPKTMKNSKERGKIKFNVSGGGGFIVIGATVVAATIAAAFVAYRDKRCRKEGGDRTIKNGADEKAEEGLKAVHENANQKHEAMEDTTEDNFEHEDGEKLEDGSEEEFSFGSLIKIQETKSDMAKEEIIETRCNDGKNDTADDFSFWNNSLNNHKETEDVDKEALEKSEERTDGVFELEEEEHTSMEQRNGHTFVVTSEKSENENYEQRVGNTQTEKEKIGEKKDGDAFAYVGVEVEQQSKEDCITNTELVDEEEANKVIDNANVVNAEENEKGEDTQMALKERDEKDKYEEVQGNITYIEVEGKVADREETFAQNEERRVDGKGNTEAKEYDEDNIILKDIADSETTIVSIEMEKQVEESGINVEHREIEENTVLYLNLKSVEEQEKARDFALIDVRDENGQNGIDYIQEGNKVREEEKQDNTNVKVDRKIVKEEDQEDIRHDEEERMVMEKENQNQYRDDTEVEIEVVQEKEENEGQKGVDNVDSSEIDDEQNGEYIIVGEGSYEDMKLVKTVENQEKIDENAYTELSKGNNADDVYNAVHAQQTHEEEEEDDVENGREDDIVENEIDVEEVAVNKELNEVEEKGGKTSVAKGLRDVVDKEEIKEQNDSVILKEMDNDVEEDKIEVQLVEKESRDTALSDEVDKEIMDITKEKDNKIEEKEQDDITDAEAGVFKLREEEELEDPSHVEEEKEEERNVIENENEDKYGNDSNINVGVKLVEGYDTISVENNPKEEEINEVETDEAKGGDIAQEVETKTANEMQHKKTEEKFDEMNKEIPCDGFAAFQQVNNMEKEDEDETEDEVKQNIKNENAKENAECLMLEKEKKTTYMSMDHISEGLFLLVFAISIAVGILAIFADQDSLPRFFRELFQFFFPSFN